jgi:putative ABC transport system substrate-binding protein
VVKTFPLLLLATVFLITISYAEAQQPKKIPRIGILISNSPSASADRVGALQKGLHELGYVEEKSIIIDYRYAEGKPDNVPALVDELIGLKVDLIVVDTSQAAQAAKNATQTIPVVFTMANDPVGDGQVVSLARPGGNLTGFSLLTLAARGKNVFGKREIRNTRRYAYR